MTSSTARARADERRRGEKDRGEGEGDRRRLEGLMARLDAESAAGFAELRAAERGGRRLVKAEMMGVGAALADPVLGTSTMEALAAANGAARGVGCGLMGECFTCRATWDQLRVPAAAVVVEISRPLARFVAFACVACVTGPGDGLKAAVAAAVKRDFLGDEGEVLPLSALSPVGGRA